MEKTSIKVDGSPIRNLLGANVKRLREDGAISQLELAKKAGLTHNFINDIENAKKGVSCATIEQLCRALNVEPFQLYMPINFNGAEFEIAVVIDFMDRMKKEMQKIMEYYKIDNKIDLPDNQPGC